MTGSRPETAVIEAKGLTKRYRLGRETIHAVDGIDMTVRQGEFLAVMGPSGSGKSTLLHLLGLLQVPDAGDLRIQGRNTAGLSDRERTRLRRERIGFVFQSFELIPTLTARENILLPAELADQGRTALERLGTIAEQLGIEDRLQHKPSQLSGGEQQRVGIARALINVPAVILADEPTGNLDTRSGLGVLQLLGRGVEEQGWTVIVVTHDPRVARFAHRVVFLKDGRISGELAASGTDMERRLDAILAHQ